MTATLHARTLSAPFVMLHTGPVGSTAPANATSIATYICTASHRPNEATAAVIEQARAGKHVTYVGSLEELLQSLRAD